MFFSFSRDKGYYLRKDKCTQFNKKLSRGEICLANFIPPANGASLGRFFVKKSKNGCF